MDTPAVIAGIGGIAILIALVGGGIEAEKIRIPSIPGRLRILSGIVGFVLIGVAVWLILPSPTSSLFVPTATIPTSITNTVQPSQTTQSPGTTEPAQLPTAASTQQQPTSAPEASLTPILPTSTVTIKKFTVKADEGWQDTGIVTKAGGELTITYLSGTWSNCPAFGCLYIDASGVRDREGCINCPDNVLLNCSHAALIAMVNDVIYCVGNNLSFVITQSSSLQLRINDKVLNDNSGSITVSITMK